MDVALISAVASIVGVVVGSAISGSVQFRLLRDQHRFEWKNSCKERMLEEYLQTVDAYSSVCDSFDALGRAMSGRKNPESCTSDEEKEETERRDASGVAALEACDEAVQTAFHATNRLSALGARRAKDDYEKVDSALKSYYEQVVKDAATTGIFKADKHRRAASMIKKQLDMLTKHAQKDLDIS